jgi:SnoaL-like domain
MKLIERRRAFPLLPVIAGFLISLSSEGQTGKSLSAADLKNIEDMTQVAMNAALARDFAIWAALFLEDAVINPPNEPAVKGGAAIRAWLEKFPPMTEFKLQNEKVEGRRTWVTCWELIV